MTRIRIEISESLAVELNEKLMKMRRKSRPLGALWVWLHKSLYHCGNTYGCLTNEKEGITVERIEE
jgi:hypothetical protein